MGDPLLDVDLPVTIAQLFERESARLWRALFAFCHDRDLASDAVAEAFAQCIRRGDEVRAPQAWVWKAAFRIAAGELKERGRWTSLNEAPAHRDPEPTDDLPNVLGRLSPAQRAAVILHHYAGYDTRAVAEIMGCAPSTARVHLTRGRRALRRLLEEDR